MSCAIGGYCVLAATTHAGTGFLLAATTEDDGATWSVARIPMDLGGFANVNCPVAGTCFVAGANTVLVRARGAAEWSKGTFPAGPLPLSAVACPTASTCLAVGTGVTLQSLDGGVMWAAPSASSNVAAPFGALACPTATICLAGGQGAVYRSTNAGATWTTEALPSSEWLSTITCASMTTCFATTTPPNRTSSEAPILRTTDSGVSWQAYPIAGAPIDAVSCGSPTDCVAVAWDGGVYTTSNAGASWVQSAHLGTFQASVSFGSVSCTSATACIASGAESNPGGPAIFSQTGIYQTTDGGITWSLIASPSSTGYGRISCRGSVCQLVSQTYPTLSTSVDGGVTWSNVSLPDPPTLTTGITVSQSGSWVLVGGDLLNGAFVATSP